MMNKRIFKFFGLILCFALCMTMLNKGVAASAAEKEPKLNVPEVTITIGGSYKLKIYNLNENQTVTFKSNDPTVAAVSRAGKVTGISSGNAVITATVYEAGNVVASLKCDVLIGPAAYSVKLTKSNLVLAVGKMKLLSAFVYPIDTVEKAVFYSTDISVARVSAVGRVRAVSAGTVKIYAFIDNGMSSVCEVTVLNEEDYAKYCEGMSLEQVIAESEELAEEAAGSEGAEESSAATGSEEISADSDHSAETPIIYKIIN